MLDRLLALSPLDGRYYDKVDNLRNIFSEFGLIKFRVFVELKWLQALSSNNKIKEIPIFSKEVQKIINNIINNFSLEDAKEIKQIEKTTNHDVKAVEYWLKEKLAGLTDKINIEFIHFACTSEDINNLSHGLMIKAGLNDVIKPALEKICDKLYSFSQDFADVAMISRTHGQVATPTTLGKEFANVLYRLKRQLIQLNNLQFLVKINGAVGNYNAHYVSYPKVDWSGFANSFVNSLGLDFNPYTTQIEPHDYMAEFFQNLIRINSILIDLNRDIWSYISIGYFIQKLKKGEIGSSTMPHKVNPIDFENSEGNLGIATSILDHLSLKLPISRWQRDLTDSTVIRNIGMSLGYCVLAYDSLYNGLNKIQINLEKIKFDLDNSWEVLAEPIQVIMRKNSIVNPYEKLKDLTRGKKNIDKEIIKSFINNLDIPVEDKKILLNLSPSSYIGLANKLAKEVLKK